jgi:hypothetical protein
MATTKQKEAARHNIEKARAVQSARAHGAKIPRQTKGLSTADQDKLPDKAFAFPKERKEPLTDAKHVRNAIARFDQVEGISDTEKDAAWKRIMKAAKKNDVDVSEGSWRELGPSSKTRSAKTQSSKSPSSKASATKASASKSPSGKASATKTASSKASATKASASKSAIIKTTSSKASASKTPSSKTAASKKKAAAKK